MQTPVFKLLGWETLRLFAHSGDTLHRWGQRDSSTPNFIPTRIYDVHIRHVCEQSNEVKSRYLQEKVTSLPVGRVTGQLADCQLADWTSRGLVN